MIPTIWKTVVALAVAAVTTTSAQGAADHLLISEVGIGLSQQDAGASAEYVELFNPTGAAISLDNYWITDNPWYSQLPTNPAGTSHGTTDFLLRFPAGYSLEPGQIAIVTGGRAAFYSEMFGGNTNPFAGMDPMPIVFQVGVEEPAAPQMLTFNTRAGSERVFNFTNVGAENGEHVTLFHYNPDTDDLVQDVDIVAWGGVNGSNAFTPKTPTSPGGKNGALYKQDNGSHTAMAIMNGQVIIRQTITEIDETQTAGNGYTGHDESTENTQQTFLGVPKAQASPGTTELGTVLDNQTPLINEVYQSPQFPSAGETVSVVVNAEDFDGSLSQVRVFYSADGGAFTPVVATAGTGNDFTANVGTFAAGTVVQYYAEATDNDGAVALLPATAPAIFQTFLVEADAVLEGDLVINEILGDNKSNDLYEWVEIHNTTNDPIDLGYFRFAENNRQYFTFPEGTIIPAKGFVIMTMDVTNFLGAAYPNVPPGTQIFDWGTVGLNNGGDDVVLVHPNAFNYRGETTFLDRVVYDQLQDGGEWPYLNQNSLGQTLELINPFLNNADPNHWSGSLIPADTNVLPGTPGQQNSIYASARVNPFRDKTFPGNNESFTVTADIAAFEPDVNVTAVRLFVDNNNSGFAAQPMTLSTGTTYTATVSGAPTGAMVRYYFEVDTSDGFTSRYPADGDVNPLVVLVTDNAPEPGDLVINEILYNDVSTDDLEYIELYNTSSDPIDLSFYRLETYARRTFTIPQGSIIQDQSYLVLAYSEFGLRATYGSPSVPVIDWGGSFTLDNDGDFIRLIHPNQYNPAGGSVYMDSVKYGIAPPWPSDDVSDPNPQNPNSTGASIELINPGFADRGTNGARWRWTTYSVPEQTGVMGTPGAQNSMFTSVSDWTLY